MAQSQIPLISSPFKHTIDIDWTYPLKHYIAHVYQEDPEKYGAEAYALNRLRQDVRGAGRDVTGRDLLYRYFGQLELLDLRFPVDEKNVKVLFTWFDAFNGRSTAQFSLAYEKASILFNMAATLSAISASQNRAEAEGRKKAFRFFQAAAGLFQYINDNFLHAPSQDLSRGTVLMMTELMLVQADECFLENSLRETKKGGLIAKLASHIAWTYGNLMDKIQEVVEQTGVEKTWLTVFTVKQKYYQAFAQQYKAAACESDGLYGEQVARLKAAESAAKSAVKLASTLTQQTQSTNFANGTVPSDTAMVLQELTKSMSATCTERLTKATRDNDMIYHENVPQESVLTPIDRLQTAKAIPISELYSQNEIEKVVGADIFAKLVPLSIHTSASLYSEEKAKLLRSETERCELAKAELNTSLEYMHLPQSLHKFKQQEEGVTNELLKPPANIREYADHIAAQESDTPLQTLVDKLESLKMETRQTIDKVILALHQEFREYDKMQAKYGTQWKQTDSVELTADFHKDVRTHQHTLSTAAPSDAQLLQRYNAIVNDLAVLKQGGQSSALTNRFSSALAVVQPQGNASESLLDLDMGNDDQQGLQEKVQRVHAALDRLRRIEKERDNTLQDLREKTLSDDISSVLILNKKTGVSEQQIFQAELEKYRYHQQRIHETLRQQKETIKELTEAFKHLTIDPEATKRQTRWDRLEKEQKSQCSRLEMVASEYTSLRDGITNGITFYSNLLNTVGMLLKTTETFVKDRKQERDHLESELEKNNSIREQALLREKINSYSNPSNARQPTADRNAYHVEQLTEQARSMSLGQPPPTSYQTSTYGTAPPLPPHFQRQDTNAYAPELPQKPTAFTNTSSDTYTQLPYNPNFVMQQPFMQNSPVKQSPVGSPGSRQNSLPSYGQPPVYYSQGPPGGGIATPSSPTAHMPAGMPPRPYNDLPTSSYSPSPYMNTWHQQQQQQPTSLPQSPGYWQQQQQQQQQHPPLQPNQPPNHSLLD